MKGGATSAAATAIGGAGGSVPSNYSAGIAGNGGAASATAMATAMKGGAAGATAAATGGAAGAVAAPGQTPGIAGAANATSLAATINGAAAQAQSTAVGSSGQAQSTAQTNFSRVTLVQTTATAPVESTATTNAIAQGGAGQAFSNPGQTAYAMATGLPGKAYLTTLVGGAGNVATALLAPRDVVFGSAIMGANYAPDGGGASFTYSASSTFDFAYRGDVLLGLIGSQQNGFADGVGFQSLEFSVLANGAKIDDWTFTDLTSAESFFQNQVIDLGWNSGPAVDLTFGYNLTAEGTGGFGFDFAVGDPPGVTTVPEPSTWAMMLLGFAGLGFAGYRRAKVGSATRAA